MEATSISYIYKDGNYLVLDKYDNAIRDLPARCIICNCQDDLKYKKQVIYYIPIWTYFIILIPIGFLFFLVFYFLFRQILTVGYYVCPEHRKKMDMKVYRPAIGLIIGAVLIFLATQQESFYPLGSFGIGFLVLSGIVYLCLRPLKFKKFKKGYFWIKGPGRAFVAGLTAEGLEKNISKA
ncbi:MAG: hypothetical protein JW860_16065 [Sedimentisphaerales bacterium]|nr:hypothetical protein [Sedimentisphaerales bacterium]